MSTRHSKVVVDHEGDLSSTWKPVLLLGFLFGLPRCTERNQRTIVLDTVWQAHVSCANGIFSLLSSLVLSCLLPFRLLFSLCLISLCLCLLSLSLSPRGVLVVLLWWVVVCHVVLCCVVSCLVLLLCVWCVWCVRCVRCVVCETLKNPVCPLNTSPCVRSITSPCMPAPRAHVFQHVCAWCGYYTGTF